ncbi:MAG: tyrosine-type recombinase/integrase [Mycobacteriales bacterium]
MNRSLADAYANGQASHSSGNTSRSNLQLQIRILHNRHTAATLLLLQGVDPRTTMELLGWSELAMTQRYQHVVSELRVDAARRLGALLWQGEEDTR